MDTDNAQGAAEPVAWMVEWTDHADFFLHKPDAEKVAAGDMAVQSLYRQPQPTLTDAERQAVDAGADALESLASNDINGRIRAALMIAANTLRGLLERTR